VFPTAAHASERGMHASGTSLARGGHPPPTMACGRFQWLLRFLPMRGLSSAARGPHAPPVVAPSPLPSARPLLLFLLFILDFFCCYFSLFSMFRSFELFIHHIHLCWWPQFLAFVPRTKGPTSSNALSPHTFILSLNFGLPSPCCYS
jgi:hypothetical protein